MRFNVAVLLVKKNSSSPGHGWGGEGQPALIKNKIKFSSYIRKFRVEQFIYEEAVSLM